MSVEHEQRSLFEMNTEVLLAERNRLKPAKSPESVWLTVDKALKSVWLGLSLLTCSRL